LQTNVIFFEPKLAVPRFRSSAIDVPSLEEGDDSIERTPSQRFREPFSAGGGDAMMGIKACRRLAGISSREVLLGVAPSPRHRATLRGYFRSCHGDVREVQDALVNDLRSYLEIGARHFAADQLIVLRLFLTDQLRLASRTPALPEATVIDLTASGEHPR